MQILMKATAADPVKALESGHVYDVEDEEAEQLVAGGYAVAVEQPEPEKPEPVAKPQPASKAKPAQVRKSKPEA